MKKAAFTLLIGFIILITSCGPSIEGNGIVSKEEHQIENVSSIDINGQFYVELKQGKRPELIIETDENIHEYIKVENNGNTVKISLEAFVTEAEELNAYITLPNYELIDLSGAVELTSEDKLKCSSLTIDASGATEVDLDLKVDKLTIDMSGASETKLSGKAKNVNIDLSGASELEAYKLDDTNSYKNVKVNSEQDFKNAITTF